MIPSNEDPVTNLGTIEGDFFLTQFGNRRASFSPDLSRIAFLRRTTSPSVKALVISNVDGTGEQSYISGELAWHGWAPDGEHFVFSQGAPPNLTLGALGDIAIELGSGSNIRWIDETTYLFLSGSSGAWTLNRGTVGATPSPIVSPAGDSVAYDFDD